VAASATITLSPAPRPRRSSSGDQIDPQERLRHERALFERYRAFRDPGDRELLVRRFLPLAHHLAARFLRTREPFDDLFQVACLGLVKAIDRFDVDRNTAFSSYAVPTILGELKRYFRDKTWPVSVPRDLKDLAVKVDRTADELTTIRGHPPSMRTLAQALGIGEDDLLEAMKANTAYEPLSLDVRRHRDEDDLDTVGDSLGRADHGYRRVEQHAVLEGLLRFLTRRQREVVRLRFDEDLTQQEIGDRVGLSQMQVSRILQQAMDRLGEIAGTVPRALVSDG
jgi:RNA polymerase sigma-B factor